MEEIFGEMLREGGKSNSLGKVNEIIALVLKDQSLLDDLYQCVFNDDAWVRMRAIDAFEKVGQVHPEWLESYIPKIQQDLSDPGQQASIKWHIAEIYRQVTMTDDQKRLAIEWLVRQISTTDVDWIVAANTMRTMVHFVERGDYEEHRLMPLLEMQLMHKSNAVRKRAQKYRNIIVS